MCVYSLRNPAEGEGEVRRRLGVVFEYMGREGELNGMARAITGPGEDEVDVGGVEAEGGGGAAGEDGRAQAGGVAG
jgi:hypothetical protein